MRRGWADRATARRPEQARSGSVLGRSHLGVSARAERDAVSFGSLGCRPDQRPASGEHEVRRPADVRALLRADGDSWAAGVTVIYSLLAVAPGPAGRGSPFSC